MALEPRDLEIIIDLLEDTDPQIADKMRRKIFEMGSGVVDQILSTVSGGRIAHREASRVLRWLNAKYCIECPMEASLYANLIEICALSQGCV